MATTSEGRRTRLAEQRKKLPDGPGVYLFHDATGKVIYVGKAKSLKKRGASHLTDPRTRRERTLLPRKRSSPKKAEKRSAMFPKSKSLGRKPPVRSPSCPYLS